MKLLNTIFITTIISISCNQPKETQQSTELIQNTPEFEAPTFNGEIIYTTSISSNDSNDIRVFHEFTPSKIQIHFNGSKFRLKEYGGLSKGNLIIDTEMNQVFQLDSANKSAYQGIFSNFDNASEILKEQMPSHFKPTCEKLNETQTIQGYPCTKYKIIRSGFLRPDTETYIWATTAFKFPPSRFDVQTDINLVSVPMPMLIGFNQGTILKMVIYDKIGEVKYEAIKIDSTQVQDIIFEIPSDYVIQ